MKKLFAALALLCSGCATYTTPGGAVNLGDIDRYDIQREMERKPAAQFPASLAIARVQSPEYRSHSYAEATIGTRYSVVTTNELASDKQMQAMQAWPRVQGVAPLGRLLLPQKMDKLDDLRVAAARVQADILVVYTIDTSFRVKNRAYGPLTAISLGLIPDRDAMITSTASAVFTDVRTGFTYGVADATAKSTGLTNFWGSEDTIDRKRLETEQEAFDALLDAAGKTWVNIAARFGK